MPDSVNQNTDTGLSRPLSDRERRVSQQAFIVMAALTTISLMLIAPGGVFGIYMIQLGVSGPELGGLIAKATPFGIAGLLCAGLVVKTGRKRMMRWGLVPAGLFVILLLVLPKIKLHWNLGVMLTTAWALLAMGL